MEQQNKKSALKFIETLELIGITFIRDYIQLLFDGPILNIYTLPQIVIQDKIFTSTQSGYYDVMCLLIGKEVLSAYEDKKKERIAIKFENDIELFVSLKLEDRDCVEAVMLKIEPREAWYIW